MDDPETRLFELSMEGYGCSQLLVKLALEAQERDNPELLRAVSGLHGGIGQSGKICGALSGGACALALHAGRGGPGEEEDACMVPMIRALVDWFQATYGARHGGIDCADILDGDDRNRLARCPEILLAVHEKVREILESNGLDPQQPSGGRT